VPKEQLTLNCRMEMRISRQPTSHKVKFSHLFFRRSWNCSSCTGKASFCFVLQMCRFGIWAQNRTFHIMFTGVCSLTVDRQHSLSLPHSCQSVFLRTHAHTHTRCKHFPGEEQAFLLQLGLISFMKATCFGTRLSQVVPHCACSVQVYSDHAVTATMSA